METTTLRDERCEACHAGSIPVTAAEIAALHPLLPNWQIVQVESVPRLVRTFVCPGYETVLAFASRIADLGEQEWHHPRMVLDVYRIEVQWWTHAIGFLHRNDFIMAAKTDVIAEEMGLV